MRTLKTAIHKKLMRLYGGEEGQSLAEYGLILALISVVAITVLTSMGTQIVSKLGDVVSALGG